MSKFNSERFALLTKVCQLLISESNISTPPTLFECAVIIKCPTFLVSFCLLFLNLSKAAPPAEVFGEVWKSYTLHRKVHMQKTANSLFPVFLSPLSFSPSTFISLRFSCHCCVSFFSPSVSIFQVPSRGTGTGFFQSWIRGGGWWVYLFRFF